MQANIAALEQVAAEQLLSSKAEVTQVSGVKTIHTQHQGIL